MKRGEANLAQMLNRVDAGAPVPQISGGYSLTRKVAQANRWRESYNPLRGLTISRAVTLLESYYRGEMADLQWAYYFVEGTDPDAFALVERRTSAICALDWDIKVIPEKRRGKEFDDALAEDQAAALREAYDRIDNLNEAIEHFSMATFRGFSHAEMHFDDKGEIVHLEPLDQWNVVRDGLRGEWKYNPDAKPTTFSALPQEYLLNPDTWIIREVKRHIDRIGLIKFVRQNLSQKDWDAFIEIYGIPGVIIIGPPNIPVEKESAYESAAKDVAEGGSGYLPNGTSVTTSEGPRGVNPFRDHLRFLQEQLILAGTGGLLTMLTQSGSGTLAGNAHQKTFDLIARAEARKISEPFQRSIDASILAKNFPEKPTLAYFDLAGGDQSDPSEVIDQVGKLSTAGYQVDQDQVSEKTGYSLTLKPQSAIQPQNGAPLPNRRPGSGRPIPPAVNASLLEAARNSLSKAVAKDLQPIYNRIARILEITDPSLQQQKLEVLRSDLPQLLQDINADPESASVLEATFSAAMLNAFQAGVTERNNK